MADFTTAMEKEYTDLMSEAVHVTSEDPVRRMYWRTIWTLRRLYETDPHWMEQTPTCITTLQGTWIKDVIVEIAQMNDPNRWLNAKHQAENLQHPAKTRHRMAELASITVYARIMFNSTVDKDWVHPFMKAYWFTLAWEWPVEDDREQPLDEAKVLPTGHHISVFPF